MESCFEIDTCIMKYPSETFYEDKCSNVGLIRSLFSGNFKEVLDHQTCKELLLTVEKVKKGYEQHLKSNIEVKLGYENDFTRLYDVLIIGISSLQLFVQVNWTGPPDGVKYNPPLQFLRECLAPSEECSESEWFESLAKELVLDGEFIVRNIRNLELLLVARAVLNASVFDNIVSAVCWRLRCLSIHQQVLEQRSQIIHSEIGRLYQQLLTSEVVSATPTLKAQLELETACTWLLYGHVTRSNEAIRSALKILGLEVSLVGAMGKRTKFQQKELSQLTVSVKVDREETCIENVMATMPQELVDFPKDVRLEDDVRLNQIAFSDSSVTQIPLLTAAEQSAVLAVCIHKQRSQPKDRLQYEEILPYLTCLISQPKTWALQMSALLQRTKLDSDHRRTLERALMQFQSLVDSVAKEEPGVEKRLAWVYASHLPPSWRIQELLANTYLSLGMVQTALDVYLSLQSWEGVIACYNMLNLRHKAAEIIRQEFEKAPHPQLLCMLGDATDDVECYKEAWLLSEGSSSLAQRHWGMYYYLRKQYAESIPHFEESLKLNSLQEALWFRLGFAALMEENWSLCATAYRRYCSLEPESFEAWNNLAKAYVKTGQKARAFRALQEAVKCNYENWRVWDNLMAVSTDCGQFEEVIRCYHRILDLKEKHVDLDVLKILTDVVVKETTSYEMCNIKQLRKLSLKLFGRLTCQVLNNSTLWQLYAQVAASDESSEENTTKVAQCLQKAYRAATQGSWERDLTSCLEVINLCIDLAKAYLECSNHCVSSNERVQILSSAKLPLKSVLTKIEKEQTNLLTGELPESLVPVYKELLIYYEHIIEEMQRL